MRTLALTLATCLGLLHMAAPVLGAVYGADVSQQTLIDSWSCLKKDGLTFAIIRCYESLGRPDSNCPHTIYNAWDGGMDHVDIYMFPCPTCGNPEGQVDSMLSNLAKYNIHNKGSPPATYGMVWLDIEGTQYWTRSAADNQAFFSGLVSRLQSQGQTVGVYTSESQWIPIMGDWSGGAHLPLWYAHYDNSPSFGDFRPFAGWTSPSIKQYGDRGGSCSASYDQNYYP